ncbi:ribonuclease H-like domain-containing protein, partial [Tanacetum coccineum]
QIRSSILSKEVLPNVRSAYATISSEESHRVAVGSIAGSPSGGSGLVYENYGFNGHTIDRCFKIIGYPADFGKKKSGQNFKKQGVSNNNYVGKSSSSGFLDEQIATLLSLIKDNKVGKNVQANMAGANQHMTYSDKGLDNVVDISHLKIKVGHPNRTEAFISKIGSLKLSDGLTLYDVMDLNLKIVLGTSDECEELYYYNEQCTGVNKNNLSFQCLLSQYDWHCRLGHPVEPVMNILKKSLNFDKPDKDLCCESASSSSFEFGGISVTTDFPVNSGHDADSSDNNFATQDEGVTTLEDNSFSEASKFPHLVDAMNQEMNALLRNITWDIVELPKDKKAIGSKWIYKIKYQSSEEIDRFKARLVAHGFSQKEGIDYEETFSPVVKMVTVRCLLNIVVTQSWPIFQLDVNNVFLYGDLDKIVYRRPPEGYFPSGNKVCKLTKSLYGLKQAPKQLNAKLTSTLTENGFSQSKSDYSLFTKTDKGVFLLYLYMWMILSLLLLILKRVFVLTKGIMFWICCYLNMACLLVNLLILSKLVISNEATESDHVLENITDYQKLMGRLIYLTNTKPDISYVVHCLSQFMHSPLKSHLKTAFKILRYLKGCPGLKIHFVKTSGMFLSAFSDAD